MPNAADVFRTKTATQAAEVAAALAEGEREPVAVADLIAEERKQATKKDTVVKSKETKVEAKPLTPEQLENLDESTMLNYNIEAKYLNDSAMILIKPVDSSKALRWVYFNNGMTPTNGRDKVSAFNVGRYKFWGFDFATVNDIEGGEDALVEGIIDDGGKIINYDTVLMKIDKVRLMGHYKKNLLQSVVDVDGSIGKAIKTAEGAVHQSGHYQKAMATHPQAKIDFYSPTESKA